MQLKIVLYAECSHQLHQDISFPVILVPTIFSHKQSLLSKLSHSISPVRPTTNPIYPQPVHITPRRINRLVITPILRQIGIEARTKPLLRPSVPCRRHWLPEIHIETHTRASGAVRLVGYALIQTEGSDGDFGKSGAQIVDYEEVVC